MQYECTLLGVRVAVWVVITGCQSCNMGAHYWVSELQYGCALLGVGVTTSTSVVAVGFVGWMCMCLIVFRTYTVGVPTCGHLCVGVALL